jgi:hypothetical protein
LKDDSRLRSVSSDAAEPVGRVHIAGQNLPHGGHSAGIVASCTAGPYDAVMPYLIDGNNLMHALADAGPQVGREALCKLLRPLLARGETAHVVFDGAAPPPGVAAQIEQTGVRVTYAAGHTADEVILKWIAQDTAPKLLTVVSSDKEIRRGAERRRCKAVTSQEFAQKLLHIDTARRKPKPAKSPELRAKQRGLSEQETRRWLKEFGLDGTDEGQGSKDL